MKKKVTVYSDYICPFCYIGKDRIDRLQQELDVTVEWKGFELHPETPPEGNTIKELGIGKFYIEKVMENVKRLAAKDNLELKPPSKISNSRMALEIAEFAREKGKFDEYHDMVFKAYWLDDKDIGDSKVLFDITEQIGLKDNEIRDYLSSGAAQKKITQYLVEANDCGISGVPTFLVGEEIIVGAQPYAVLKRAVEQAKE